MKLDRKVMEGVALIAFVAVTALTIKFGSIDNTNAAEVMTQDIQSGEASRVAGISSDLSDVLGEQRISANTATIESLSFNSVGAAASGDASGDLAASEDSSAKEAEVDTASEVEEKNEVASEEKDAKEEKAEEASEETELDEAVEAQEEIPEEWQNRVMVKDNVDKYVNIREEGNEDASILGKLYRGSVATIVEKGDAWTKISSGSVEGYVCNEYLAFGLEAMAIAEEEGTWMVTSTEGGLRVREEPTTDSAVISALSEGQELRWNADAETEDGWVAVKYKNGTYYVSADYVDVELVLGEAVSIEEERAAAAAAAAASNTTATTTTQGAALASSYDDVTLLAALIWCEAGNQGDEGRLAVGAVVVNRVWSGAYPNSVYGVIYQSGQFGPASSGKLASVLANGSYSSACVSAAEQALSGVTNIGGALHFASVYSGRSGIQVGGHVFY